MSIMDLAISSNVTLAELKGFARNLRDRYNITFQTYFYKLHKNELYNLVREKINLYNLNQKRLRKYNNNRIANEFISLFNNYNFKENDEIINLPFSKVKNNDREIVKSNNRIQKIDEAFQGRIKTFEINNTENIIVPLNFLYSIEDTVITKITKIKNLLKQHRALKVNSIFFCDFINKSLIQEMNFKTANEVILRTSNSNELYNNTIKKLEI